MIVSKSQSQATPPRKRSGPLALREIGDSVLYHSIFAFSSVGKFLGHLSKTGIFRQAPQGGILPTTPFPNNDCTSPRCRLCVKVTATVITVPSNSYH